ncbi:response regulator [Pseudorhodoferax sp. Leaf274]|uniref:response regulator n=1 Tax=Pseudorhodoferax sp. Leaf274 TaxID=1736318 RepID=UPI000703918F|nr:response regulator [Pseudorhodoferax sp. Leaf274]KQP49837.1 hypothetical protein ASF44_04490 [Pseudorhodoferax sp. Leaf274]
MIQRVFLVEDNPLIRSSMVEMMEELVDAKVVGWAETELQAIAAMRSMAWDVAVVDLFLASGSGIGVARAFADRPAAQRLFVATNYATPDIRERCSHLRVDAIFDKSTELDRLVEALGGTGH